MRVTEYSTQQAAEKLGITKTTLLRWLRQKLLPPVKTMPLPGGGIWRIWTDAHINAARKIKGSLKPGPKPRARKAKAKPA